MSNPNFASQLNAALFLTASALYFTAASHEMSQTGKGAGSAVVEKMVENSEADIVQEPIKTIGLGPQPVIIYVMGVCGCGKSTVGTGIAQYFSIPYVDGDTLHTPEAVEQMRNNIPLTDSDRIPWLKRIRSHAVGELEIKPTGCVLAASSLKHAYREIQRGHSLPPNTLPCLPDGLQAPSGGENVKTIFVYLYGTKEVLAARMKGRSGHYMKEDMLNSQLATIEEPPAKESEDDIVIVNIDDAPENVIKNAVEGIQRKLGLRP
ncbi:Gluconate kinase [Phaffia rhodozyma]|uniref:gluconokinase n=1 Tax=Phaffia rhodozyma TaxID=264483 RepID=A0A0F7SIS9_PHARH|nr:Gluconate kinase [Phaffia rhodozyma]